MKFYIEKTTVKGTRRFRLSESTYSPRDRFNQAVSRTSRYGVIGITLIRVHNSGEEVVLKSWTNSDYKDGLPAPYKYKVHSARSPLGTAKPTSSNAYYDTLEEAQEQAEKCIQNWDKDHEGCIIYKAVQFVRRAETPVIVEDIE